MLKSIAWKLFQTSILGSLLFSLAAVPASAADLRWSDSHNNRIFEVPSSDTVRNLYTAGSQVIVNANPSKDLVVAGATLEINGNVADDLLAAGGNVNVKGDIGGSARIAGGNIHIDSKSIGEDLVVAGGTVYVSSDTVIKGDLIILGGTAYVDGTVSGNLRFTGGSLSLNATVNGNADVKEGKYFELGSRANILGTLNYSGPTEYVRNDNAKTAAVNYTPRTERGRGKALFGLLTIGFLVKLASEILAAFILFALAKRRFIGAVERVDQGFWKNVAVGLVGAIIIPVIAGILFITLVGMYAAILLLLIYFAALLVSWILGASYFGTWVMKKLDKKEFKVDYVTIAIGLVIASVLKYIPLLGWLFAIILVLAGLGSIIRNHKKLRE